MSLDPDATSVQEMDVQAPAMIAEAARSQPAPSSAKASRPPRPAAAAKAPPAPSQPKVEEPPVALRPAVPAFARSALSRATGTIRVVSIDDHADLRRLYRLAFAGTPLQMVGEASDGRQGITAVMEHKPDLVLLDLSMPNMDGLETLLSIRRSNPDARVVVLSGFTRDRVGELVRSFGAIDYIEKGVRPGELVERLIDASQRVVPTYQAPSTDQVKRMKARLEQLI